MITSNPILPGLKIAIGSIPTSNQLKITAAVFNVQFALNPPTRFSITDAASDRNNPANKLLYRRLLSAASPTVSRGVTVPQVEVVIFGDFIPGHRFINSRGVLDYYGYFYSGGGDRYRDSTFADIFSQSLHPVLAPHQGLSSVTELASWILPQNGIMWNSYSVTLNAKFNSTLAAAADVNQYSSMNIYSFHYVISKLSINYFITLRLVTSVTAAGELQFLAVDRSAAATPITPLFSTSIPVGRTPSHRCC